MKRLRRSALILSVNALPLSLSQAAFAQDSGNPVPLSEEGSRGHSAPAMPPSEESSSTDSIAAPEFLPTPEVDPSPPSPTPPEDRPYDAPLGDDPVPEDKSNFEVTPPTENGPAVDARYNSVDGNGESAWSLLRIGPTVQVGFPHPITYGVEGLFAQVVSFGFSTGRYNVTQIDKANVKIKSWDVFARWHPFAGNFFVGGAYGHQEIKGRFEDDVNLTLNGFPTTVPARVDAEIKSNYIAPRFGWMGVYPSGLTFGFELGAQIPLSPDTQVDATIPGASPTEETAVKATADYKDLKKQADDAVKIFGKKTIPFLTLLKVGWLF